MARTLKASLASLAGGALVSTALLAVAGAAAQAEGLNVLTWEGYTDPSFADAFT